MKKKKLKGKVCRPNDKGTVTGPLWRFVLCDIKSHRTSKHSDRCEKEKKKEKVDQFVFTHGNQQIEQA